MLNILFVQTSTCPCSTLQRGNYNLQEILKDMINILFIQTCPRSTLQRVNYNL